MRSRRRRRSDRFEFGAISIALAGEIECGDTWRSPTAARRLALMVVDGLGHGPLAATAAARGRGRPSPSARSTRRRRLCRTCTAASRAAAAPRPPARELHAAEARVDYAGVGNICGAIVAMARDRSGWFRTTARSACRCRGTQQFEYDWPPASLVVMHSDGMSARWNLARSPGSATRRHPAIIAARAVSRSCARARRCHRRGRPLIGP